LNRDVTENGAKLVVVNGTSRIQVRASEVERVAAEKPLWNLDRPTTYIRQVADIEGFAFHDLVPEFRAYNVDPGGVLLHGCLENNGEGHWSAEANALAAEYVERYLVAGPLAGLEPR
jgi:hypothetical protein